jgi:hypothetical protein
MAAGDNEDHPLAAQRTVKQPFAVFGDRFELAIFFAVLASHSPSSPCVTLRPRRRSKRIGQPVQRQDRQRLDIRRHVGIDAV